MAAISTDYATIALTGASDSSTATTTGDSGFGEVLATQLQDNSSTTTATSGSAAVSDADLALTSYSSGQVVASAAATASDSTDSTDSTGTSEASTAVSGSAASTAATEESGSITSTTTAAGGTTEESSETSTEESGAAAATTTDGWPAEALAEWTPSNMQFYDELSGQWVDDNIPHRLNSDGQLEYQWEGQWYLDSAVRHRISTDDATTQTAEGETTTDGSTSETSAAYSLEGDGPFTSEEYYNTALGDWKTFNLPYRENDDGSRDYYWNDQWWADSFDHRSAA